MHFTVRDPTNHQSKPGPFAIKIGQTQKQSVNSRLPILYGLVKSLKRPFSVIPAQAGIQSFHVVRILWIPVFTGMTPFRLLCHSCEGRNPGKDKLKC